MGRAKNGCAAECGEKNLGPHGTQRKFEAQALAAAIDDAKDNRRTHTPVQWPAPEWPKPTDRNAATKNFIGLVHGGHGFALCQIEGEAAVGEKATQCYNEGRDFCVGRNDAVEGANQRAKHDTGHNGNDPDGWVANAEYRHKLEHLKHCTRNCHKAEHGTHGKIQLPHDNEQHHAGGHDGDR